MENCPLCALCAAGIDADNDADNANALQNNDFEVLFTSQNLRVILLNDAQYPGFCRVIWRHHVREMTDLMPSERDSLMQVVWLVEQTIRQVMQPDKINLASLGNMVPHLHWHIIPRYADDAHFPDPIWAAAKSGNADADAVALEESLLRRQASIPALRDALKLALSQHTSEHAIP